MPKLTTLRGLGRQQDKIRLLEAALNEVQKEIGKATSQSAETWHDNAPYEMLKYDINILNRRLAEAHHLLDDAQIVEYPYILSQSIVQYGAGVIFTQGEELQEYKIVGYGEEDIGKGRILYDCPLAKILIGHRQGESFDIVIHRNKSNVYIREVYLLTEKDLA